MSNKNDKALNNAGEIIERFGGIRPMAAKIGAPVTTVQGWKKRDVIPAARRVQILEAAAENNIDIADLTNGASVSNENSKPAETKIEQMPKSRQAETPVMDKGSRNHDNIMAAIEENGRKTTVSTIWVTTGLILFTGLVAALFFMPKAKENSAIIDAQSEKISVLENEVENVKKSSFMQDLVPEDIKQTMAQLQDQARSIQNTMQVLTARTAVSGDRENEAETGILTSRLRALEEKMETISGESTMTALVDRIRNLEESMNGQEQLALSMTELRAMINGNRELLDENLAKAQEEAGPLGETLQGVSGEDLKAAAMLIAFSQLRNSLNREEPFENDLAVLQKLAGEDNTELQVALSKLAPHADDGILTTSGLSREFKGLAGDIVVSSLKGEEVSVKEKFQARLHDMLKVEKEGESLTGTDTQVKVSKAQKLLDEGDVKGAVAILQTLDGEASATAQPFIEAAQASIIAEQVEKMLGNNILSKFTDKINIPGMMPNINQGLNGQQPSSEAVPPSPVLQMPNIPNMPNINQLKSQFSNGIPMPGNQVVKDPNSGVSVIPRQGIDINGMKKSLENAIPAPNGTVTKDENSGVTILPKQPGFKGFSGGE